MFIILLILARASCDWVEISQQHWTKPLRQTHPNLPSVGEITDFEGTPQKYTTVRRVAEVERNTKANRIYINDSLPKYSWNEDDAFDSDFDGRHVHLQTSTIGNRPEKNNGHIIGEADDVRREDKYKTKGFITVVHRNEINKSDVIHITEYNKKDDRRVPYKGNVQKTQLSSSEKSLVRDSPINKYNNIPVEVMNLSDLDYATVEDVFATVELSDDISSDEKIGKNKHITAVGPVLNKKSHGNKFGQNNSPLENGFTKDEHRNYARKPAPKTGFVKNTLTKLESEQTVPDKVKTVNGINNSKKTFSNQSHEYMVVAKSTTPMPKIANEGGIQPYNKNTALRFRNIGNVKRVQLPKSTERASTNVLKPSKNTVIDNKQEHLNEQNSIEMKTKAHREYENGSNINKDSNPDKVKRIYVHTSKKIDSPRTNTNKTEYIYEPNKKTVKPSPEEIMMEEILKEEEKMKAATRLGSNIGVIKRVNPNSNHMKITEENTNVNTPTLPVNILNITHPNEEGEEITATIIHQIQKPPKHEYGTNVANVTQEIRDDKHRTTKPPNKPNSEFIKEIPIKEHIIYKSESDQPFDTLDHQHETFANLYSRKNYENVYINKVQASNTRNKKIANKQPAPMDNTEEFPNLSIGKVIKTDKFQELGTFSESESQEYHPVKILHEPIPEFVTKKEIFSTNRESENEVVGIVTNSNVNDDKIETTNSKSSSIDTSEERINSHVVKGNSFKTTPDNDNKQNRNQEDQNATHNDTPTDNTKANTIENLIKFLKIVTDTISRNTKRTINGKLQYLEDLRDLLMENIAERIDSAFPDDEPSSRRNSRSAQAAPRGHHVEFPSSESALMTISFLTFAVFLIKLVLQVIHTYKNKTMVMPGLVAAVGRAFAERRSRKTNLN